jgi:HEAT repeat protein
MTRLTRICWVTLAAFGAQTIASLDAAAATEAALLQTALDSRSGVVERTRAFTDLRAIATEESIADLSPWLGDRTWGYAARSVLEVMPGPAADRALLAALEAADNPALAAGLVNSLGRRQSEAAIPAIARLMVSAEPALAAAAVNALANIGSPRAADALAGFAPAAALRVGWADATLRLAERLWSTDHVRSLELQRSVRERGPPTQRAAAAIALARGSEDAFAAVAKSLKSGDAAERHAALAAIRAGEFGAGLFDIIVQAFPSLPTEVQVQVLSVLHDRGDRGAAALARAALSAADARVRAAAARLLSVVGDVSDGPTLVRMMIGPEEPAPSARLALARLPGHETTVLLLERYRNAGADRAAALEVLVSRGYRALLPDLLRPDNFMDPAFGRLMASAIATLGAAADLERVLSLYCSLRPEDRTFLDTAVRRIAAKHASRDEAAARVIAALGNLPTGERSSLVSVLPGIGGDTALAYVAPWLESPSAETRRAALRTFGNWRDTQPSAKLFAVAANDPDATVRSAAIHSATAMFRRSAVDADAPAAATRMAAAIAGLHQTWELASEPDARHAIVVALRGLKDPKAVAAAAELEQRK